MFRAPFRMIQPSHTLSFDSTLYSLVLSLVLLPAVALLQFLISVFFRTDSIGVDEASYAKVRT